MGPYEVDMPVKSEAQRRFMGAVYSGSIKKPGLSKSTAKEFLDASKGKKYPEKAKPKKK